MLAATEDERRCVTVVFVFSSAVRRSQSAATEDGAVGISPCRRVLGRVSDTATERRGYSSGRVRPAVRGLRARKQVRVPLTS
jgi:hypothetical protein